MGIIVNQLSSTVCSFYGLGPTIFWKIFPEIHVILSHMIYYLYLDTKAFIILTTLHELSADISVSLTSCIYLPLSATGT